MFNSSEIKVRPGSRLSENPFRTVDYDIIFRRIQCYRCDLAAVYKFRVKQIRRTPELLLEDDLPPTDAEQQTWKTVPRFAEIPETVRCKRCGEVLGLCTECIF
jgi:hypothetical protein